MYDKRVEDFFMVCYKGVAEIGLASVLKMWLGERRFMEVEVENVKVTIKLKITPAKRRGN